MKMVWVFNGENYHMFPGGVFSQRELAEEWIRKNQLSGILTAYPIDQSVYDWVIGQGNFRPKREDQKTPAFIGGFSSARQEHYHCKNGEENCGVESTDQEETIYKYIGNVMHYYKGLGVAIIWLEDELRQGDEILIAGKITDLVMHVSSMEKDHRKIDFAERDQVALKVDDYVQAGDIIYKVRREE